MTPPTPRDIALITEATAKLKAAQSLDEVWALHGLARAAHLAARRRGARKAAAAANVIRFDAERRIGELTRGLAPHPGGRPRKKYLPARGEGFDPKITKGQALAMLDVGPVTTQRASDYEAMLNIPPDLWKVERAKPDASTRSLAELGRTFKDDGTRKPTRAKLEPKAPTIENLIARLVEYLRREMAQARPTTMEIEIRMRDLNADYYGGFDKWRPLLQESERWNVLESVVRQLEAAQPLPLRLPAGYAEAVHVGARGYVHRAIVKGLGQYRAHYPATLEEDEWERDQRIMAEAEAEVRRVGDRWRPGPSERGVSRAMPRV